MLKGIKKNMIVLRRPESAIFEEAYFILKEDAEREDGKSLVEEANRILNKSLPILPKRSRKKRALFLLLAFMSGAVITAGILLPCLL